MSEPKWPDVDLAHEFYALTKAQEELLEAIDGGRITLKDVRVELEKVLRRQEHLLQTLCERAQGIKVPRPGRL